MRENSWPNSGFVLDEDSQMDKDVTTHKKKHLDDKPPNKITIPNQDQTLKQMNFLVDFVEED